MTDRSSPGHRAGRRCRRLAVLLPVLLGMACGDDAALPGGAPAAAALTDGLPASLQPFIADWRRPDTAPAGPIPVVLLLHGCAGLEPATRQALAAHAAALAAAGYGSITVDSFGPRRRRDGSVCRDPALARHLVAARRAGEVQALLDHLAARPDVDASRLFLLGQSHGGAVALADTRPGRAPDGAGPNGPGPDRAGPEATDPDRTGPGVADAGAGAARPAGIVALYPWCPPDLTADPTIPVLLLQAASDDWAPVASCDRLATRPAGAARVGRSVYADTEHGFDLPVGKILVGGRVLKSDPGHTRTARIAIRRFFDSLGGATAPRSP